MIKRLLILLSIVGGSTVTIYGQVRPTPTPTPARPTPTSARPTPTPTRPNVSPTPSLPATPNLVVAVPPSRIAVIDTSVFSDEKVGIFRVIDAALTLGTEFRPREQELQTTQARLNT